MAHLRTRRTGPYPNQEADRPEGVTATAPTTPHSTLPPQSWMGCKHFSLEKKFLMPPQGPHPDRQTLVSGYCPSCWKHPRFCVREGFESSSRMPPQSCVTLGKSLASLAEDSSSVEWE